MNSIISLSDGAGTTITNGKIVTNDLSGNTVTAGTLNAGDLNLTGSVDIPAVNDITTSYGLVSLKNAGKTYLVGTTYIDGGITASVAQTINLGANLPVSTATSTTLSTQILPRAINDLRYALYDDVSFNISCGASSLVSRTSAQYNVSLGKDSMRSVNTGSYNVCVGMNTMYNAIGAGQNTVVGSNSGSGITSGSANTIMGVNAGNGITTGGSNFSMGSSSGPVGAGEWSVAIGTSALQNGSSYNIAIGGYAMQNNSSGQNSICLGYFSQVAATAGGNNVGIGAYNYQQMTTGTNNVGIGYSSGRFITTGQRNVFLGALTGTNGSGVDASNSVCIGYGVTCTGSNQFILGASTHAVSVAGTMTNSGLSTFTGGITASGTQTITFGTNAPTMSGANIGSATIPNAALQSNVTLNDTTSTISALKTFTGGITASATQTITFGSNAPTMSGANIGSATIPDGALSSNVELLNATQTISALKTFTGGITASATQTITFGTNAPTMSGANIGSATIPYTSIADNVNLNHRSNAYNFYSGSPSILTTGDTNTFYGYDNVGSFITTGGSNAFFGSSCGRRCALGSSSNTAFGVQAMGYTISSNVNSYNCAIGNLAMGVITTGNRNTAVGYNVAGSISSGSYNSFVGNFAGYNTVAGNYNCGIGDSCFTGNIAYDASYCSFVGSSATLSAAGLSYSTVIGAGATSATSSSITLGRTTDTTIIPSASVQYGGSYRPNSVFQTISANTNWNTTPPTYLPQYILFSGISTTTYTLTLPAISSANVFEGMEFQFRRTNTTASATTTSVLQVTASGTDTIYGQGIMTTAASTNVLPSGFYSGRLVCVNKTTTPYNWAYFT
jgi:hypothetical protein